MPWKYTEILVKQIFYLCRRDFVLRKFLPLASEGVHGLRIYVMIFLHDKYCSFAYDPYSTQT